MRKRGRAATHPRPGDSAGLRGRLDLPARRTAICRRPAATRAAASNTATTPTGAWPRTPTSSSACSSSARRCRASGSASRPISPRRSARRRGRETVLATIVRLLDTTYVRIGNEEYARDQPLVRPDDAAQPPRRGHRASRLRLRFRGKSGKEHEVALDDPRVARVVRRCQAMPGQELFQYVDEDGARARASARPTSTTTSATSAAPTSPPRTFAPGTARAHALDALGRAGRRRREPPARARRSCWPKSPSGSATRSRCAGSRTSIRACSRCSRPRLDEPSC